MSKQIVYALTEIDRTGVHCVVGVAITFGEADTWTKKAEDVVRHAFPVPVLNSEKMTLRPEPEPVDEPFKNHWDPLVSAIKDLSFRLEQIMGNGIKLDLDQRTLAKISKVLK